MRFKGWSSSAAGSGSRRFFSGRSQGKARSRVRERNGLQLALSLSYFRNPVCVRAEVRVRARVILSGPAARVFHSHIIVILADFTIMCICMRIWIGVALCILLRFIYIFFLMALHFYILFMRPSAHWIRTVIYSSPPKVAAVHPKRWMSSRIPIGALIPRHRYVFTVAYCRLPLSHCADCWILIELNCWVRK